MTRSIYEAARNARDKIGGEEEDALKVAFAEAHEDEYEQWVMDRLEKQAADDAYEAQTREVA